MPVVVEPSFLGRRVTIRRAAPDAPGRLSDVVGDLVALDDEHAVVESRTGIVRIPRRDITRARPAAPSTRDELALEAVAAQGWQAVETAMVGGWLLRAAGGFTGRANSVLPLGPAPLDEALSTARAWYAERGIPLRIQVPVTARRLLDATLAEAGWPAEPLVHVLARRTDPATENPQPITVSEAPDDDWLAIYRDGEATSAAARAVLTGHERVAFAAIRDEGGTAAVGRAVLDADWVGLSAIEVRRDARRRGLGRAMTSALLGWGAARGARYSYLQVSSDNAAANAMYASLGYWQHHDYHYRVDPEPQT
jgi:ribosomal protein S18 acetylase RimI-like enzyme